ncbi:hypothetical protein [Gemmata obscuriglobus]|uniref:hypothetical protein n=1 Tax=Gemmata obscuriglobus TaxID=114 RepID=UPI001E2E719B|nr:hypothetical protein [Gemmata obscuriglobus]
MSTTRAITLLKLTKGRTTDRKLRLFACGCLRLLAHHVTGDAPSFLNAVEAAATPDELRRLRPVGSQLWWTAFICRIRYNPSPCRLAEAVTDANARNAARRALGDAHWRLNFAQQASLAREIFGNPFRPIDFTSWRTGTTVALANGMYESRDFSAMPILADALQDAGCDNFDVLTHCRDASAEHVRGCWVVDGVLGLA